MKSDFWHQRWQNDELGFHESQPNRLLTTHFDVVNLCQGGRIFLPLCGKTLDIGWLLSKGFNICGAELSPIAVAQLFEDLGLEPVIEEHGALVHYSADHLRVFVGDIFDLSGEALGQVDLVYDRAALVALPDEMRRRYSRHLRDITGVVDQLIITFEYDQPLMNGPPFSISGAMVHEIYDESYDIQLIESRPVAGKLKGVCPAIEQIWLLSHR